MQTLQSIRTHFPKRFVSLIVVLCILPFGLQFLPSVQKYEKSASVQYQQAESAEFEKLSPKERIQFVQSYIPRHTSHVLLESAGFVLSLLILFGIIFHYNIQKKAWYAIFGIIFLSIGFFDLYHYLAFDRILISNAPFQTFIPISWLTYRIASIVGLLMGLLVLKIHGSLGIIRNWTFLTILLACVVAGSWAILSWELFSKNLPQFPQHLFFLHYPSNLVPLGLIVFLGIPLLWKFHKKTQTIFSQSILLSLCPSICLEIFILLDPFQYKYIYATSPFAHYLEILTLVIPLIGITIDNYNFYIVLQTSQKIAQKASQAKSRFIKSVSNELKTPIESVIGFSRSLIDQTDGPVNDMQIVSLQRILEASGNLASLVDEVLDVAQIEAGKVIMNLRKNNVIPIIESAVTALSPVVKEKNLTLEFEKKFQEFFLNIDPPRFFQILTNLIENAIQNTEEGKISIQLEQQDEMAVIRVTDTGKRIPETELPHIFEPFAKPDALAKGGLSMGIGLTITKRLVEGHNGTVEASSKEGEGTTFTIVLPCTSLTPEATASAK